MQSKTKAGSDLLIAKVAEKFGLTVSKYLPVQKGYRNESHPVRLAEGTIVNIMLFKGGSGAERIIYNANSVSGFLADNGLPARKSIDERILKLSSGRIQNYAALYNFLPGDTIAWEAYSQKHIKLLGKTLGDMHHVLQYFDATELPAVADVYIEIVQRMAKYFRQYGVTHAVTLKLGLQIDQYSIRKFEVILQQTKHLANQQALHMDFVRSNILFMDSSDGPIISGILDFEKTARGNPLFDIARTLAFLLVDCKFKSADQVKKYFLNSGYQKRSKSRLPQIQINNGTFRAPLIETLIDIFLLYDFYKFLRHNPYEYLNKNEHFVRTRDILLQRDVIFLANIADK